MSSVPPQPPDESASLRFWWIREGDQILGPYTGKQMLSFVLKGRVRRGTQVRPDTGREWRQAVEDSEFSRYFAGAAALAGGDAERRMPHFLIIAESGTCPMERIDTVIGELGPHYPLMSGVWLLHCRLQVEKIRVYLVRQLAGIERLFIVDMRTGTWAGHELGEAAESGIRELLESEAREAD